MPRRDSLLVGQIRPRKSVVRIKLDRAGVTVERFLIIAAAPEESSLEHQVVGFVVVGATRQWIREERHLQRTRNRGTNLLLSLEYIVNHAVVAFRPQVIACLSLNELCGNSQRITRLAHTAFKKVSDCERFADL